jgi:hypothetical protein
MAAANREARSSNLSASHPLMIPNIRTALNASPAPTVSMMSPSRVCEWASTTPPLGKTVSTPFEPRVTTIVRSARPAGSAAAA